MPRGKGGLRGLGGLQTRQGIDDEAARVASLAQTADGGKRTQAQAGDGGRPRPSGCRQAFLRHCLDLGRLAQRLDRILDHAGKALGLVHLFQFLRPAVGKGVRFPHPAPVGDRHRFGPGESRLVGRQGRLAEGPRQHQRHAAVALGPG